MEDFGRETMHDFQRVAVAAVLDQQHRGHRPRRQAPHSSGDPHDVDLTMTPVRTDRGPLVAIGLREPNEKYRQTKLFRGLLEAAPDGMVIVNRDGAIVLVNAQVEKLFGYQRAELVGEPVEILVPDRYSGMHMAFRNGYVSEPRTRPMGLAGDLHARRKDGSEFPIEVTLSPLETDEGLLVSAAVRDISERRRMQEETDRVKDEFFATVSHELRTPLTSMIGYGELMTDLEELEPAGPAVPLGDHAQCRARAAAGRRPAHPGRDRGVRTGDQVGRDRPRARGPRGGGGGPAARRGGAGWRCPWRRPAPPYPCTATATVSARPWTTCSPTRSSSRPAEGRVRVVLHRRGPRPRST